VFFFIIVIIWLQNYDGNNNNKKNKSNNSAGHHVRIYKAKKTRSHTDEVGCLPVESTLWAAL